MTAANPYSPPASKSDLEIEPTVRHAWVAVVLALLSPAFAMLYVARVRRALAYVAARFALILLSIAVSAATGANLNITGALLGLMLAIVGAVDAVRLVRAWPGAALPWYARAAGLVVIVCASLLSIVSMRLFVVQPFRIPSTAMQPTLLPADYILVSKSAYGLRMPWPGAPIAGRGQPRRGDIAVFIYPDDTSLHYVKRVIGVPGDTVAYTGRRLVINGRSVEQASDGEEPDPLATGTLQRLRETLDGRTHLILVNPGQPAYVKSAVRDFPLRDNCTYSDEGFACSVPAGHYFVMGDNRDSSSDSRYWGFVPQQHMVGRAFLVWCSEGRPARIGLALD